jgi:hypothetical protein
VCAATAATANNNAVAHRFAAFVDSKRASRTIFPFSISFPLSVPTTLPFALPVALSLAFAAAFTFVLAPFRLALSFRLSFRNDLHRGQLGVA